MKSSPVTLRYEAGQAAFFIAGNLPHPPIVSDQMLMCREYAEHIHALLSIAYKTGEIDALYEQTNLQHMKSLSLRNELNNDYRR
jgi:hypothetical protein